MLLVLVSVSFRVFRGQGNSGCCGLRRESIKRANRMTAITGDKKKTGAMMRREKNTCARSWQPGDPRSLFQRIRIFRPILTDGLA